MDLLPGDSAPAPAAPPAAPAAAPAAPPAAPAAAPAAPAPAPPSPGEVLAPDPNAKFLETLPEDLRGAPSLKRYSSSESLARAYLNLEQQLGAEKVPIPKDPNDQEAWDRYYKAGGRPDDPKDYRLERPAPEALPEGVVWDEGMEGWFRQVSREAGLNQNQFTNLVGQYRDRFVASVEANSNAAKLQEQQTKQILVRDWGSEYEAKRALANAAFAEMPADLQQAALANGFNRMPSFAKWLVEQRTKVTGELQPREPGASALDNPSDLQAKIAAHRATHEKALMDVAHPDHKRATAELTDLYNRLYPEPAKQ